MAGWPSKLKAALYFLLFLFVEILCMFLVSPKAIDRLPIRFFIGAAITLFFAVIRVDLIIINSTLICKTAAAAAGLPLFFIVRNYIYTQWIPPFFFRMEKKPSREFYDLFLRRMQIGLSVSALVLIPLTILCFLCFIVYIVRHISLKKILRMFFSGFSFRCLLTHIIVIFIAAVIGLLLLMAAFSLPVGPIEQNVAESAQVMEIEYAHQQLYAWCSSVYDFYTDTEILLEASDPTDDTVLNRSVLVYQQRIQLLYPNQSFLLHYKENEPYDNTGTYPRYWHGYLFIIKPLLSFLTYQKIQTLNGIIQISLSAVIIFLMFRKKRNMYIFPYLVMYLMLMPVVIWKTMEYSPCYYIFSAGIIILLLFDKKPRFFLHGLFFFISGILTAYFDYLTFPVTTFCLPVLIYLFFYDFPDAERAVTDVIKKGFQWGAGYAGMWTLKWVLASLITKIDVFQDAYAQILYRISNHNSSMQFTRIQCIEENLTEFFTTPFALLFLGFIIFAFVMIICRGGIDYSKFLKRFLPAAVVFLIPFLWYCFALNHSFDHKWMTNKNCSVLVLSIGFLCSQGIECSRNALKKSAQEPSS